MTYIHTETVLYTKYLLRTNIHLLTRMFRHTLRIHILSPIFYRHTLPYFSSYLMEWDIRLSTATYSQILILLIKFDTKYPRH